MRKQPPQRVKKFSRSIATSMTPKMHEVLLQLSKRHGLPKSVMLRMIVIWALDTEPRRIGLGEQPWIDNRSRATMSHEVFFVMTAESMELFDGEADRMGVSRSQLCRLFLMRYLNEQQTALVHVRTPLSRPIRAQRVERPGEG